MKSLQDFVVGFFTQHLLPKFFAVVCAGITIGLIDRAQNDDTVWLDARLNIMRAKDAEARPADEALIVLRPAPDVYVANQPSSIKVRVRGPKRQREAFLRAPRLDLRVTRAMGGDRREAASHVIQSEDLTLPNIQGVTILVLDSASVSVDVFEEVEVKGLLLETPPSRLLPSNMTVDLKATTFTPPKPRIRGPRAQVSRFDAALPGADLLPIRLVDAPGGYFDGQDYRASITRTDIGELQFVGDPTIGVRLELAENELQTLDLGKVRIYISLTEANRATLAGDLEMQIVGNITPECGVVLKGSSEAVAKWSNQREALREQLSVHIDPKVLNDLIASVISASDSRTIPLRVYGLPDGLSTKKLDPTEVTVEVRRKAKKG